MNLLYESFPEQVTADGQSYAVLTDFREWLRFADILRDPSLSGAERASLCGMWTEPETECATEELLQALLGFYRADGLLPENAQEDDTEDDAEVAAPRPPVFDWAIDAPYILGDFRRFYGMNLLTVRYLHWWEFLSLFRALPDDSQCMKRIAYRSADLSKIKNPAERARIAKIQRQIALPFEFDDEMIGAALWSAK